MSTDTTPREADHPARAAYDAWTRSRGLPLWLNRVFDSSEWKAFAVGYEAGRTDGAKDAREADAADARMRASERAR